MSMKRELWILTHVLRLTPFEIACELSISTRTVRNWLHEPPRQSPYYRSLRELIVKELQFMPSQTEYQRAWRDSTQDFVDKLLTPQHRSNRIAS